MKTQCNRRQSIIYLFLVFHSFVMNAQTLTDSLTNKRDVVFYKYENFEELFSLKRILIPNLGEKNSIRNGREILVSIDECGEIIYRFKEIDGYSSLFIESSSFNVFEIDNRKILIIEIEPFEALKHFLVYEINKNGSLKFIERKVSNSYKVNGNEIQIKLNPICEDYFCSIYGFVLPHLNRNEIYIVDFYLLKGDLLVKNNFNHKNFIKNRIKQLKKINIELDKMKLIPDHKWIYQNIDSLKVHLNKTILKYEKSGNVPLHMIGEGNPGAHKGLDFSSVDGQDVISPISGRAVNRIGDSGPLIDIFPNNPNLGFDNMQILYIDSPSNVLNGVSRNINAGDVIGKSINLQNLGYGPKVGSHVHLQLWKNGVRINPYKFFFK